jgi:hypothetical protein
MTVRLLHPQPQDRPIAGNRTENGVWTGKRIGTVRMIGDDGRGTRIVTGRAGDEAGVENGSGMGGSGGVVGAGAGSGGGIGVGVEAGTGNVVVKMLCVTACIAGKGVARRPAIGLSLGRFERGNGKIRIQRQQLLLRPTARDSPFTDFSQFSSDPIRSTAQVCTCFVPFEVKMVMQTRMMGGQSVRTPTVCRMSTARVAPRLGASKQALVSQPLMVRAANRFT